MPLSESQCGKGPFYFLKTPSWKKKAGNKRKSGSRLIGSARLSRGSRAACWEPRPRRLRKEREALTCCDSEEAGRGGIFDCEWGKRRMMANHLVKPDSRNCKRTRELEPQLSESPQVSSLGKSDSSLSECSGLFYKEEALEKDLSGDV